MQTRRDWVLTIGQAAAGIAIAWQARGAPSDAGDLPPGIYLPSTDHLGHALMSADRYHSIPPGCPTGYVRPPQGPFQPRFLSPAEFTLTCCLTQLVLGDVPEAVGQDCAEWIDLYLASEPGVREAESRVEPIYRALASAYYGKAGDSDEPASQRFRDGLERISKTAKARYHGSFQALNTEQQADILHSIGDAREETLSNNSGTQFFTILKTQVIKAFYTSQTGLKELDYKGNAFYARSPGCPTK